MCSTVWGQVQGEDDLELSYQGLSRAGLKEGRVWEDVGGDDPWLCLQSLGTFYKVQW